MPPTIRPYTTNRPPITRRTSNRRAAAARRSSSESESSSSSLIDPPLSPQRDVQRDGQGQRDAAEELGPPAHAHHERDDEPVNNDQKPAAAVRFQNMPTMNVANSGALNTK